MRKEKRRKSKNKKRSEINYNDEEEKNSQIGAHKIECEWQQQHRTDIEQVRKIKRGCNSPKKALIHL